MAATPTFLPSADGWVAYRPATTIQIDSLAYGVEADLSAAGIIEGSDTDHFDEDDGIRGRLGFAVGDLLLYGTVGLAVANLDTYDEARTISGWVAGIGAEYMVAETVSLKAEYLYTNFGTVDVEGYGGSFDLDGSAVRVGANFHF